MPSFDFDAARRERLAGFDPIEFTIGGEHFVARPAIPFAVIAEHLSDTRKLTDRQAYDLAVGFVRSCLEEDDHDRFDQALHSTENPVDKDEPTAVLVYLVGCYVGRPTNPSSDSSPGRAKSGGASKKKPTASSVTRGRRRGGASSTGSKVA